MPSPITYQVLAGWDTTDAMTDPPFNGDYDDITADVKKITITRGKEKEAGTTLAAICDLNIWNPEGKYSPPNESSPIHDYLIPYKQIKIIANFNGTPHTIFYGFIEKYQVKPHWDIKEVMFHCLDGMDFLARTMICQDNLNLGLVM